MEMSSNHAPCAGHNLIVISSDEMRGDVPGFMGNPDCRTPHLDRLAQRGVVFTHHFTVHGKCVPSRIAMMTGRYSHTDGIRTVNETNLLRPGDPNLMETLMAHGYEAAYFGHNHVFEKLYDGNNKKGESIPDYHSFTEGIFDRFVSEAPAAQGAWRKVGGKAVNYEVDCPPGPRGGFTDDVRARQAIHYLTTVRDRSRPFYLHLNFGAPHPAYQVEEPYFSMYDPAKIRAFPHDLPENAPLPLRMMREIRAGEHATDADFRRIQAVYYGMVTKLDTLIGQVLDTVEAEGLLANSIVMFWVDHGDFAGQYGLVEKWDTAMQDCILHVPQALYAPCLPSGVRVDSLTEHVDIAPTVLELLGIAPDEQWVIHGTSLLPAIRGERRKEAVFADGGHEEAMIRRFNVEVEHVDKHGRTVPATHGKQRVYRDHPETMARAKMVRTEDWKLVVRLAGGNELYHLKEDPRELRNLYGDRQYDPIVMGLMQRMIEWCLRTDTDRPFQPRVGA